MTTTVHAPRWRRLLDGGRSWGSLDVYPARYGVARYRLVVFPPGLYPADRALLRAYRSWRVWGTALWPWKWSWSRPSERAMLSSLPPPSG